MKTRRMQLDDFAVFADAYWHESTLTFTDASGETRKQVVIRIERPWQIQALRTQLDKIVKSWDEQMNRVR